MGSVQSQRTSWVQFKVNEPYEFSSKLTNLMDSVQSQRTSLVQFKVNEPHGFSSKLTWHPSERADC